MARVDTNKLGRLRHDLGNSTSFVAELTETFRQQVEELANGQDAPAKRQAELVHLVLGTSAMMASSSVVGSLQQLEDKLRRGDAGPTEVARACDTLMSTLSTIEAWLESAPPDGEPLLPEG
jgi:hypothetical protein